MQGLAIMFIEITDIHGTIWHVNPRYVLTVASCQPGSANFEIVLTNKEFITIEQPQADRFLAEAAAMRSRRQLL
jgi:hypothetical protein